MPSFNFVKQTSAKDSFRVQSIKGQFDLNIDIVKEHFTGNIDIEDKEWNVGVIVGSSGSGKTTIAKHIFGDDCFDSFEYDNNSIIDNMPQSKTTEEVTKVFNSTGFATAWSWLKPYGVLSNGEKMRVDLSRCILSDNETIVFDEFTSVVDRVVAKTASFAISKSIRKAGKKFVAVSCHRDILEWIEPDWVYDTDKKEFFFAQTNTNAQQSISKYGNAIQKSGSFLKNITI